MDTEILNYVVRTKQKEWVQLIEDGVNTTGIYIKPLRFDEQTQRHPSFLSKFEPGAHYPFHDHPAGEEIYILQGTALVNGEILNEGDYLYTPPGFKHDVKTEVGCLILFIVPEEVVIL